MPPYATETLEAAAVSPPKPSTARRSKGGALSPASMSVSSSSIASVPSVGAPVLTAFGIGTIVETESVSSMVKVQLQSWTLANGSAVVCHLRRRDVTVMAPVEVPLLSTAQRIAYAKLCKDLGVGAQQNGKLHGTALLLHEAALEATQAVLKDCDASERPNLFLSMVKGHNHAASCSLQLDMYRKARDHAKNAIAVLDALEKKGQQQTSSSASSTTSNGASTTSSEDTAAQVGKVKLFGECRCKSLILVARSYLENPKCKARHRDLAKSNLDQASAVIKKYSTKEYTQIADMKPVLKQLVSHKRNIIKYRQIAKQMSISSAASVVSTGEDTSYSSWFANKRVWFADERTDRKKDSKSKRQQQQPPVPGWTQRATSAMAYTGFVALGAFMLHQVVMAQRKK